MVTPDEGDTDFDAQTFLVNAEPSYFYMDASTREAVAAVEHLRHEALKRRVTLLFAGHDHVHCHARVLREAVLGVEEDLT